MGQVDVGTSAETNTICLMTKHNTSTGIRKSSECIRKSSSHSGVGNSSVVVVFQGALVFHSDIPSYLQLTERHWLGLAWSIGGARKEGHDIAHQAHSTAGCSPPKPRDIILRPLTSRPFGPFCGISTTSHNSGARTTETG